MQTHPPPDPKQNPRLVDRHQHQARVELKRSRSNEEALETFFNIKISETYNTNLSAPETAMSAALRGAMRRKARAS